MADAPRPRVARTTRECQELLAAFPREGAAPIALVPTMGYLHAGHAALLREARRSGARVVCSIFVNPTQFGPNEDLAQYPRDLERDLSVCAAEGVELVFAPESPAELYPPGAATRVRVEGLTEHFCGASRPGHFDGVATVVTALFGIVRPARAYFGEKDFQQLAVIRRFTRDLHLGVEIVGVPTVREADGLALSSRNAYLDAAGRQKALALSRALAAVRRSYGQGERSAGVLRKLAHGTLAEGVDAIDYVELADPEALRPLAPATLVDASTRLLMAAFVEGEGGRRTRLIDNGALQD
ncbi:MAG: pantoate--beta-alanine ligase [Deltaproteobacteria bacterium]|nr:pantoate--beta-alanine ligase [Deltaproteobacteria bacterium]